MGNKKSSSPKMIEADNTAEKDLSKDLVNFFLDELKDILWAEKHLAKLFQKMRKAAIGDPLKDALAGYLDSVESHLEKLKHIFEILGETPREKRSELVAALAEEAKETIEHKRKESDIGDIRLISAAQKILHHKIASYGSLIQLAGTMGNEEVISIFQEALSGEKQTAELLNNFAESNTDRAPETKAGTTTPKDPEEQGATVYDSINLTGKHMKE